MHKEIAQLVSDLFNEQNDNQVVEMPKTIGWLVAEAFSSFVTAEVDDEARPLSTPLFAFFEEAGYAFEIGRQRAIKAS